MTDQYVHEKRFSRYDMVLFGVAIARKAVREIAEMEFAPGELAKLVEAVSMEVRIYEADVDKLRAELLDLMNNESSTQQKR